jgi:hypothetical protein
MQIIEVTDLWVRSAVVRHGLMDLGCRPRAFEWLVVADV